jgi:hypothetical protein
MVCHGKPKIEGRAVSSPTPFHSSTFQPNPRLHSGRHRVFEQFQLFIRRRNMRHLLQWPDTSHLRRINPG